MSRNLTRGWPLLVLAFASEVWALGLGDIRLSSALNEPLRAEIELLSAMPEEVQNLSIALGSSETFARYGLDRPLFLQGISFRVAKKDGIAGKTITVVSQDPITEPFITFLVEATWSRGRLLREYTLLLDPPTFAPPPAQQSATAVTAPQQSAQTDSGRIERRQETQASPPTSMPPKPTPAPSRSAPPDPASFDTTDGGDYRVQRGDTLWGIAQRMRPDSRLTMNQMMLAIFEANPGAFAGNINVMSAGATLRIPSADEIFKINRGNALNEVQRHNSAWSGVVPDADVAQPSLVLVPPDDEQTGYDSGIDTSVEDEAEDATDKRIREIEGTLVDHQNSLIEIQDDELAALRQELARLRGEEYVEPDVIDDDIDAALDDDAAIDAPPDLDLADDDIVADTDTDDIGVDGEGIPEDTDAADDADAVTPPPVVSAPARDEQGIVGQIVDKLFGFWGALGAILLVVLGVLVWFARRAARGGDEEQTGVWDALDADDMDGESLASTERLSALAREDDTAIVVVEQESAPTREQDEETASAAETIDAPIAPVAEPETGEKTSETFELESTFSSETAVNLDASDPVAEADFHMAYGLYDQAADLINGALEADPEREDLLAKLCEIYFVWGNQDAFIDAASRLRTVVGIESSPEWDKIFIMGQQITADHEMFSGAGPGPAREVDLSFEGALDEESDLDMDLAAGTGEAEIVDLGQDGAADDAAGEGLDMIFDAVDTEQAQDLEETEDTTTTQEAVDPMPVLDDTAHTAEMPTAEAPLGATDATSEAPTIEEQFRVLEETGELPAISDDAATLLASLDDEEEELKQDLTAEIELDDLGLDLHGLAAAGLASDLDDTDERESLRAGDDLDDTVATGHNPEVDLDLGDSTGVLESLDLEDTLGATGDNEVTGFGDTGRSLAAADAEDTDVNAEIDTSLLDATGQTQVLTEDELPEDAETLLASLDDDDSGEDGDFDFAKTEALQRDVFTGSDPTDETGELPSIADTDMDLDLDDLTAALRVSEIGDTVDQPREDETVEHPGPAGGGVDLDVGGTEDEDDADPTARLAPEDVSGDLHDARTMTEVGTKLDLARAYVDMGDPGGARSILEEVLEEGDDSQKQQAQQLLESLPG